MEYAAPLIIVSDNNIKRLQGIQYQALKIILKAPFMESSSAMHKTANIESIKIRLEKLSTNYLTKAINSNNPLITKLIKEREMIPESQKSSKSPLAIINRIIINNNNKASIS